VYGDDLLTEVSQRLRNIVDLYTGSASDDYADVAAERAGANLLSMKST
jgi:hypothetical protein